MGYDPWDASTSTTGVALHAAPDTDHHGSDGLPIRPGMRGRVMWTVVIRRWDGTQLTASAVTRADARAWARRFRSASDRSCKITGPSRWSR